MKVKLNKNAIRLLIVILIVVLVLVGVFHLVQSWDESRYQVDPTGDDLYEGEDAALTYLNGKWYARREGIETVLLIGIDKFDDALPAESSYINNQQSDFLLLLMLDHKNMTSSFLHINRDTMAEIQTFGSGGVDTGVKTAQLALAHTYGSGKNDSCRNTVSAVSNFLYGAEIDHYVSLTMEAVAQVNDAAGGVPVSILDDFTMVDPSMVKGTTVKLTGEQALTYVRARGELADSTNIHRMERQRQYLHELYQQVRNRMTESDDFLLSTVIDVSPYLVSDCTVNQLASIGDAVMAYTGGDIRTIEGEAVKGDRFMEFYADEDALKELVLELFYTETEKK